MAETKKRTTGRGRGASATKSTLEQLLAARDEVDADTVSLREREEAVLAAFAQATVDRDAVIATRDAELAKLEKRATTIREQAEPKLAGIDERVAVTLLQLTELGRNADQVAKMTGVPVKKVRSMIRDARKAAPDESRAGAGSKPMDSRAAAPADAPSVASVAKETAASS
ncbi:hypothetical protein [Amycolatopsis sp. lyj-23]|uniref:hypothetical protein n=1 Tax=Amycolatopsis sp. lyj-23 TaxID=2789283 RepID=UPI00397CCC7D